MSSFARSSGVLLHLTSLPGPHGSGDMGAAAYRFVDWLVAADQSFWQILPLKNIGLGNSPYSSLSAFAGNALLIDLDALRERGWLAEQPAPAVSDSQHVDFASVRAYRMQCLDAAWQGFRDEASAEDRRELSHFCEREQDWLRDYAIFMSLHEHHGTDSWLDWPRPLARREPAALANAGKEHAERIAFHGFCQWVFRQQWLALKQHANARGIAIIGDIPFFVAHHSAEVWAHPALFRLDAEGRCEVMAGVPPDSFSADGQCWRNPLYRWDAHQRDGFAWWIARIRSELACVDVLRLDHFRGFTACWELPPDAKSGREGHWTPAPGTALFDALRAALGPLPLIAEDPGVAIAEIDALRHRAGIPGMRILQFAFNGEDNRFPPHRHDKDAVVYTGTHDNNTTLGWWAEAPEPERARARSYFDTTGSAINWTLLRAASASVAVLAIHPLQDVLDLGAEARMNYPGRMDDNWAWRFTDEQLTPARARKLAALTRLYQRGRQ